MATARPMPESAPGISALRPGSRPNPRYVVSPWSGAGSIAWTAPGPSCCWAGNGGRGYCVVGSWAVYMFDMPATVGGGRMPGSGGCGRASRTLALGRGAVLRAHHPRELLEPLEHGVEDVGARRVFLEIGRAHV